MVNNCCIFELHYCLLNKTVILWEGEMTISTLMTRFPVVTTTFKMSLQRTDAAIGLDTARSFASVRSIRIVDFEVPF